MSVPTVTYRPLYYPKLTRKQKKNWIEQRRKKMRMKALRVELHDIFDPLWQKEDPSISDKRNIRRAYWYKRLSKEMELPLNHTHFSTFKIKELKKAKEIINKFIEETP
jgi:hypothetical protein